MIDFRKNGDRLQRKLVIGLSEIPHCEAATRREITAQELGALLSGIDLSQAQRRKRYQRKSVEAA